MDKMALGIVTNEVFDKELARCAGITKHDNNSKHIEIARGRGAIKEVPEIIREIISEEAILGNGSIEEVADKFGVSESSVSAYKKGAHSTASYHEPNEKLQKKNDNVRNNIITTARSRLLDALNHITPEKMADAKLRDIASVAKDMSAVISNTEPQVSPTGINAQFIFHVPKARKESDFEIIDVTT